MARILPRGGEQTENRWMPSSRLRGFTRLSNKILKILLERGEKTQQIARSKAVEKTEQIGKGAIILLKESVCAGGGGWSMGRE